MRLSLLGCLCFFIVMFGLVGCGARVEVPPGHVGKVLSPSGLQQGLKTPSSFRLPAVMAWDANYYLILVETSDQAKEEQMTVFMPKDNLNLQFDLRMTLSIPSDDEKRIESIFSRLSPDRAEGVSKTIDFDQVFRTYAQPIIREKAREVLANYTIAQVLTSRDAVSTELEKKIREELANAPITILNMGLADIQPPAVIVTAQEAAKEREIAISRAEAEKMVKLTEAQAALEVAKKQQEVDLVEAETQARVNEVLAKGVTPAFVTQRMIKVLEELAKSPNKVFIVPDEVLGNPALMLGISQQALSTEPTEAQRKE